MEINCCEQQERASHLGDKFAKSIAPHILACKNPGCCHNAGCIFLRVAKCSFSWGSCVCISEHMAKGASEEFPRMNHLHEGLCSVLCLQMGK